MKKGVITPLKDFVELADYNHDGYPDLYYRAGHSSRWTDNIRLFDSSQQRFVINANLNGLNIDDGNTIRKNNEAGCMKAFLIANAAQKQSQQGVKFSIKLQNDSNTEVNVDNPLEVVSIRLSNIDSEYNMLFPYKSGIWEKLNQSYVNSSFIVDSVRINGKITSMTFGREKQIFIPAKGNYELFLRIKNVLRPGAVKPYSKKEMIPVPRGKYRLLVILPLIQGTKTEMIGINPVMIDYE